MVHGSGQSTTDVQCRVFVGLSLYSHQTVALTVVGELFLVVGVRTDDVNQIGRQQLTDLLQTRDVFFNKVSVFGEEVGTGVFRSENLVPVVQYVSVQRLTRLTDLDEEIVDVVEEAPPQGDVGAVSPQLHRCVTRDRRYAYHFTQVVPRVEFAFNLDAGLGHLIQVWIMGVHPL